MLINKVYCSISLVGRYFEGCYTFIMIVIRVVGRECVLLEEADDKSVDDV
jgi:hypothetical protein